MTFVLGRTGADTGKPAGLFGHYRAPDGSRGAALHIDIDGPHAVLVVGKRGYGKSYTVGVLAEELAGVDGVAPVVVDPMGVFPQLARGDVPATVVAEPAVRPDALDPRSWCAMLALSPESGAGSLVWQAAAACSTLDGMRGHVANANAREADQRAARNHLDLAATWGVFDAEGLDATALADPAVTVVDASGLDAAPMNAVCRGIAEALYRARVRATVDRLPWLLVDEAHTFLGGVAGSALETVLTRGRGPGMSLVLATQRPGAVPEVVRSQSDLVVSHRLTSEADVAALRQVRPTYMDASLDERMPTETGEVVVVDDSTETVHAARVRSRHTPHGGDSPSASALGPPDP